MKDTLSLCKEKPEIQELFANRQPGDTVRLLVTLKIDENLEDRVTGAPCEVELAPGETTPEPEEDETEDAEDGADNPMGPAVLAAMMGSKPRK